MELREFLGAIRAHWRLIVVVFGLAMVAVGVVTWRTTPTYVSSTELYVSTSGAADLSAAYQGNLLTQQRVASYAKLLDGELVAERVIDRLNLDINPQTLLAEIVATSNPDTVILTATVTDPSPERAQLIADALGKEFAALVTELETQTGTGSPAAAITVVKQADLPTSPTTPNVLRNLALGALLGLVLGVGLSLIREFLDNTVKNTEDIYQATEAATVGGVMYDPTMVKRPLVALGVGHSQTAEAFRQIRTNLQFLNVDHPPRVFVITSAVPGEGKTVTAINLALVLAQSGQRIVLVEADMRRPRVTSYMRLVSGAGLTNVLAGNAALADVMQPYGDGKLSVVAAGPNPPNPSELLGSAQMRGLLRELEDDYDYVIIDAPPLLPVTDAAVLAVHADGAVIVTRHGTTKREQLRHAAEILSGIEARLLGTILNMVPQKTGGYGYGYGYSYSSDRQRRRTHRQKDGNAPNPEAITVP